MVPEAAAPADTRVTRTACSYCGVGCGIEVTTRVEPGRGPVIAKVSGDKLHPTNHGRLCTKGATHAELMRADEQRMRSAYLRPARGRPAQAVAVDTAVGEVATRMRAIIDEHGPNAVAVYVSGQMSTEAQYLATKLAKGYLRTTHIESNSRLCMASAGTGYKQSFGSDGPPGSYQDFDKADLFLVIGSNMADCHPILYLRMVDRLKQGAKLIVVDPRRTTTADRADLYLPVRPGSDLALLNGLLHLLVESGDIDEEFIAAHTEGWEQMPGFLADYPPERVAELTGLSCDDIRTAAGMIADAGEWMSCWTMGLNQSTHGTWNTNAINNLHMATGALCRPGSGPLSLTGQPNAMGGREMGYMGPGLPGQRVVTSEDDRRFCEQRWGLDAGTIRSDVGPGTIEMFSQMASGDIKACWIICTNPVASVANRRTVIAGLEAAELVVVQDAYTDTATAEYADVLLPAALWAESDQVMINSERNVTLLQQSTQPLGEAKPDWQLIAEVATALGFGEAFAHTSASEVFDEITEFWNPRTGWDLRGVDHDRLRSTPLQWPCPPPGEPGGDDDRHPIRYLNDGVSQTLFTDDDGTVPELAFATPSRRAQFLPRPHMDPAELPDDEYPMVLNTGRLQHQWHTMTKTGKVAKLNKLNPSPFVEIHPDDAERLGIRDEHEVEIASRRGRAVFPAVITDRVRPGNCFTPFHWNDEHGEYLTVNAVTNDAVDPVSLQPEFKACAVSLRPVAARPEPEVTDVDAHPLAAALGVPQTVPELDEGEKAYVGGFLAGVQSRGGQVSDGTVATVPVLPPSAPVRGVVRMWVDGMLAGMYSGAAGAVDDPVVEKGAGQGADGSLIVLWASQTGGAEEFAGTVEGALTAAGYAPRLVEMDGCGLDQLAAASRVVVVTSTFGDGGPPDDAADFWERLSSATPDLGGVSFAVLGMGDSSYDDFCGFAAKVDDRFAELGARRLTDIVRCEPDETDRADEWLQRLTPLVDGGEGVSSSGDRDRDDAVSPEVAPPHPGGGGGGSVTVTEPRVQTAGVEAPASVFTRANPVHALLVRNTVLTGAGSQKEVRTFGFDLADHDVEYEAGDSLGVMPTNSTQHVDAFLVAAGLDGDVAVDGTTSMREALRTRHDICRLTPGLLKFVAERSGNGQLATLLRRDNKNELAKWMWGRHAVDLLRAFPIEATPTEWTETLGGLQPRQYSISSSPRESPQEVQLTVSVVRYDGDDGTPRGGVCSTFLADRADDAGVPIFLNRSPHFRPPADPGTPMIMIGPGTGIAPFRGFLHERRALGHRGDNWLFFGDQHAADNFYYRSELEDMFRDGFLTRLDVAFSRDQRERIYVQDRMVEHGALLWRWLESGAHFYVCGDATRMARDVDETLLGIISHHGRMGEDEAKAYRKELVATKRYVRDVY
ncbi:bifunctional nitrate reductase/sulfite reductase flavoprotein subunit alpha [Williamsia sterculiae]|uniref:bifunctional nitrate reductase/sulfite reductase flavoprotein subunit alpha n=1 Tax=Williamsia sterculiae TaxID=1344003 RepID=UPI00117DB315|nr:bifunctional nitrate reductase/sulfite reductase flavoprotein subunit alpha [Williamsia sterculiae]